MINKGGEFVINKGVSYTPFEMIAIGDIIECVSDWCVIGDQKLIFDDIIKN